MFLFACFLYPRDPLPVYILGKCKKKKKKINQKSEYYYDYGQNTFQLT